MYNRSRTSLLRWLKVPSEPHPPIGNPASLRIFRAGKNYFWFRLTGWALGELLALAGIVFWVVIFVQVEDAVKLQRQNETVTQPRSFDTAIAKIKANETTTVPGPDGKPKKKRVRVSGWAGFKSVLVAFALQMPDWTFPVLWGLKLIGFALFLVQIPLTYAARRLDYEMRWYVVTDRSLRIRTGVWKIQELTMSFANLQQVVVTQGPLQRVLGLGDVLVQSAGGGSGGGPQAQRADRTSLHQGHFHGVDNAGEIRDLILERLRKFRETGLGDPEEEIRRASTQRAPTTSHVGALAAVHDLRDEARALRAVLS